MGGLVVGVLAAVVCGISLLYWFQDSLIFFPRGVARGTVEAFSAHAYRVPNGDTELHGWFVRRAITPSKPLIVYYGGNAEEVSGNLSMLDRFPPNALLLMNYRGYGDSGGSPSEAHLFSDALVILDAVMAEADIGPEKVVLMGRSLGSGVAVHVASRRPVRGLILVTPFDSLVGVARRHYPYLPVRRLLRHRFESAALAPGIQSPLLSLVAEHDEIVPRNSSMALAERWGGPVRTVIVDGATHNDIEMFPAYWEAIDRFLASLPPT